MINLFFMGFPGGSVGKESTCIAGDPGSIPGLERSTGQGRLPTQVFLGFPCGSAGKESTCSVGDLDSIPGLGRSPGEGKGYPVQYSGLENSVGSQRVWHDWVTFIFLSLLFIHSLVGIIGNSSFLPVGLLNCCVSLLFWCLVLFCRV